MLNCNTLSDLKNAVLKETQWLKLIFFHCSNVDLCVSYKFWQKYYEFVEEFLLVLYVVE